MKQKEQWIDEVMNSLQGIQPAQASDKLTQRLLAAMPRRPLLRISRNVSWLLAAGVALLLCLNVATLVHVQQQRSTKTIASASANVLGNEYFSPLGTY